MRAHASAVLLLVVAGAACGGGDRRITSQSPPPPPPRDDTRQRTPLHDAAMAGDLERITALLDGGADLEAVEETYGHTPLLLALEFAKHDAARLLLERGASTAGDIGRRALTLAARDGAVDIIDALLDRGIEARGTFALQAAARFGHAGAIERLLAAGEPVDEVEPNDGWTPLLVACIENRPEAARVLLSAGASVTVRDARGTTVLHWAVYGARPEEVHVYSDLGSPHDTVHVPQRDAPLIRLLVARGAPIDAADGDGNTALHRAVLYQARNAVEALIAAGADRTLRDREGRTPLELARARGHTAIAERLAGR